MVLCLLPPLCSTTHVSRWGGGKRLEGGGQGEGMGQERGNNALSKIITVQDNTIDYGGSQQCCLLKDSETVIKCC